MAGAAADREPDAPVTHPGDALQRANPGKPKKGQGPPSHWCDGGPWVPVSRLAVDDLGDAEVFEAFDAEFEAVAGLFGAAEGDAGVHGAVFVDPDGAGLDAVGDFAGCGQVGDQTEAPSPTSRALAYSMAWSMVV